MDIYGRSLDACHCALFRIGLLQGRNEGGVPESISRNTDVQDNKHATTLAE